MIAEQFVIIYMTLCYYLIKTAPDLQLPVQSVPITTKIVSSNPGHGEMNSGTD